MITGSPAATTTSCSTTSSSLPPTWRSRTWTASPSPPTTGSGRTGPNWAQSNVDVATSPQQDPLLDANQELLPGSPAIDAGTAFFEHLGEVVLDLVATRYLGTAPDLGAFEAATGCSDGLDNDSDGLADFPDDPGCDSASDFSERSAALVCDDGIDNDGDGRIDFDPVTFTSPGDATTLPAGVGDPGCRNPSWWFEAPQCQDGSDNDGETGIDYDGGLSVNGFSVGPDPQCVGVPWKNREKAPPRRCGVGFELALLSPGLVWLYRRRGAPHALRKDR